MSGDYALAYGTHATPEEGRCAMEWVSLLAGEPHGDEPTCVSPVVRAFCISLNDSLDDEPRQLLRPYLTRTIGTADDGLDEKRAWMAMDWMIRDYAPAWISAAGLPGLSETLEQLDPIMSPADLPQALRALSSARRQTRDAWTAGMGPARLASWAPWTAGRAAAREAAWRSAGAAAWAAARLGIGDMDGDRARALVRETAGDAAALIARPARFSAGRAAARAAAREALAPTLHRLERSAFSLLDRLLPTETVELSEVAANASGRDVTRVVGSRTQDQNFSGHAL